MKITGTRSHIIVEFDHRKVKIEGELTTTPAFYAVKSSMKNWESPYNNMAITEAEKSQIVKRVLEHNNPDFKIYFEE